jgi:hypothetical protein
MHVLEKMFFNVGSSFMDAFKYSDIDDWRTAWKVKIEPHLVSML